MKSILIVIVILFFAVFSASANEWDRQKKECVDAIKICYKDVTSGSKECNRVYIKCVKNITADPSAKSPPKSSAEIEAGKKMVHIGELGGRSGSGALMCESDIKEGFYNPESLKRAFLKTCPLAEEKYNKFINEYNSIKGCEECQKWLNTSNERGISKYKNGVKKGQELYPVVKEYTDRLFVNYTPPKTTCWQQNEECREEYGAYHPTAVPGHP